MYVQSSKRRLKLTVFTIAPGVGGDPVMMLTAWEYSRCILSPPPCTSLLICKGALVHTGVVEMGRKGKVGAARKPEEDLPFGLRPIRGNWDDVEGRVDIVRGLLEASDSDYVDLELDARSSEEAASSEEPS